MMQSEMQASYNFGAYLILASVVCIALLCVRLATLFSAWLLRKCWIES